MRQRNRALLLVGVLALGATGCGLLVDVDRSPIDGGVSEPDAQAEVDGAPGPDGAPDTAPATDSAAPDSTMTAEDSGTDSSEADSNVADTGVDSGVDAADSNVIGMTLTPGTWDFTLVELGAPSAEKQFTLTNVGNVTTGIPAPTFTGPNLADFALTTNTCTVGLAPNGTCTLGVTFTPSTFSGETGSLSVTATNGGTQAAPFRGAGTNVLVLTPNALTYFGTVTAGTPSSALGFTLINTGPTASGTPVISLSGANSGDFHETDNCSAPLASNGICTINVTVDASAVGSRTAGLSASAYPGGGGVLVVMTANGAVPFTLTPVAFDFGTVATGESATYSFFTLTNAGTVTSGVPTLVLSDTTNYALVTPCASALAASGTCTFGVTYAPAAASSGATVTANGGSGTAPAVDLTGNAAAGVPLSANVLLSPGAQDFGSVAGPGTFTVNNTSAAMVTLGTPTIDGNAQARFAVTGGTCASSLPAAMSCTIIVTYTPTATPNDYASLLVPVTGVGTLSAAMQGNP